EADFYGAMDGASKFVKGDAIAAIIILAINIVGGFVIGVVQLKMQLGDALGVYTLLTVGEGLTSQIPALLIATATGMIVTRAASESGGNLLSRVTLIRRQIATDLGIIVPTIRIRDDLQLPADTYVVRLRGVEVARGEVRANRMLAMNPGTADGTGAELEGLPAIEPAFGLPARWIVPEMREHAEMLGYTVVDPTSVIT